MAGDDFLLIPCSVGDQKCQHCWFNSWPSHLCARLYLSPAFFLSRCGCVTMLKSPNKVTAVKQWEQRWVKNCLCGGLWRRMPLSYS